MTVNDAPDPEQIVNRTAASIRRRPPVRPPRDGPRPPERAVAPMQSTLVDDPEHGERDPCRYDEPVRHRLVSPRDALYE